MRDEIEIISHYKSLLLADGVEKPTDVKYAYCIVLVE